MNHVLENNILRSTDNNNSFLDIIFAGTVNFPRFKLQLFVRYVDDTLVTFENKTDATKFLKYLNSQHNNLEFTNEQENNDIIPFLDLLIIRDRSTDVVDTAVYRKPTLVFSRTIPILCHIILRYPW